MSQKDGRNLVKGRNSAAPGLGAGPFIIKACDMCRRKKIKCQPTETSCLQCIKYKTLCHFTPLSVKRGPRRAPGQRRVEELENRLKKMEEKLKRAPLPISNTIEDDQTLVTMSTPMDSVSTLKHYQSSINTSPHLEIFGFQTPIYELLNETRCSGLGLTSPLILLSTHQPQDFKSPSNSIPLTRITDIFSQRIIKPLPPKSEALFLIQKAFQGLNAAFPIFNQTSFLARFHSSEPPYEDASWWACINVCLALAHRFRSIVSHDSRQEDLCAWGYFQNALAVMPELTLGSDRLSAVQALAGMAIIVQGSPNLVPYASFTAMAVKGARGLDLHRCQEGLGLEREVVEERKRVFWVVYLLDRDVAIRTRRPPLLDDEDMDVELPSSERSSSVPALSFLNDRIELARIQGQVYKKLLSVSASRQSYPQRIMAIRELEGKLQTWRARIPIDFQQEGYSMENKNPFQDPMAQAINLRLRYFNTLNAIHSSMPVLILDVDRSSLTLEQRASIPPPIIYVAEARRAIKLLHVTPQGDYACIWIVLHIFVGATQTLLNHLLKEPGDALASSDLQLIDPLLKVLEMLAKGEKSVEVTQMYTESKDLFERAKREVDCAKRLQNSQNDVVSWIDNAVGTSPTESGSGSGSTSSEGQSREKESLEDFIRRIESISAGYDDITIPSEPELEAAALDPGTFAWPVGTYMEF